MPLVALEQAVGRRLARPLIGADGRVLLQAHVVLTAADVGSIRRRLGLNLIDVRSDFLPDGDTDEADLSPAVRTEAVQTLAATVSAIVARGPSPGPKPLVQAATAILEAALDLDGTMLALDTMRTQGDALLQHSVNTAVYAVMLGLARRLRREQLLAVALGGMLHDLGKALVPPAILNKPGRLTPEEFAVISTHPELGRDLIARDYRHFDAAVGTIALSHHERLDGSGYPRRLRDEDIPLFARIVTIADVFDALCAVRSYKHGWAPHRAANYLRRHPDLFDRDLVDLFVRQVALYPSGSLVLTAKRLVGVVIGQNPGAPWAPIVLVLANRWHLPVEPYVLALADEPDQLPVAGILRHLPAGLNGRVDRQGARAVAEAYLLARRLEASRPARRPAPP